MGEVKIIPKLRFREFSEPWTKHNLGEIAEFSKGKGISKSDIEESGEIECVRYGELYTTYNEVIDHVESRTNLPIESLVLSEANDIIIPASGETQLDIATASCVLRNGIALSGDLNIIKTDQNGVFTAFYLNSKKKFDIAAMAQGNSVVHLYSKQLKTLNLNLPTLPEQTKIANFLTAVDAKIANLSEEKSLLENYKKGVMQKLFNGKWKTENGKMQFIPPSLRFKQDDGSDFPEWETKRLGKIGKTINGLTGKTKENFGEGFPYIQYKQIFDSSRIDLTKCGLVEIGEGENQSLIEYGDVLFTTSSETPNEIGTASVLLDEVERMYLNSFCFCFRIDQNVLNPEFSQFLFRSANFRRKMIPLAQGSTRYNISKSSFVNLKITIPNISEQTKIANFLTSIDEKINATIEAIEKAREWKKGLLQQLFI